MATVAEAKDTPMIRQILEDSKTQNKSVNLYVKGQALGGLVTKIGDDAVEIRNREYGRIVVRLDSIDAVAMM
jgi:hypothetical protein